MTIQIPRNDTVKNYQDWIIIAVKTETRLATYSFIVISPQDLIFHIDDEQYRGVEEAIRVGQRFIDLQEEMFSAKSAE